MDSKAHYWWPMDARFKNSLNVSLSQQHLSMHEVGKCIRVHNMDYRLRKEDGTDISLIKMYA